jgi:hypothetical protein
MLEDLENQLYEENSSAADKKEEFKESDKAGANENSCSMPNEYDWRGGNSLLERRHNFETHNRPQLLHMVSIID